MTSKLLLTTLAAIMVVLIIPLIILLFYLGKYIKENNGNASKFRRVFFWVSLAKAIFLVTEILLILLTAYVNLAGAGQYVLLAMNIAALMLCYANWYALYEIRFLLATEHKKP